MCLSCLHWCMNNNSWTVEVLNAAKLQAYDSPAYLLLNYAFEMSTSEWLVLLLVLSVCTFWFMFLEHWAPWVPAYLTANICLTADMERRRHLRSSTTTTLVVPPVQRFTLGDRAFPVAAPRAWNSLPPYLQTVSSLVPFRHQLKTFLFVHSFDWH